MNNSRRNSARAIPPAISDDALYGKAMLYARRSLEAKQTDQHDA